MISTMKEVREALQEPVGFTGSSGIDAKLKAAITKLDALIAATEKAEPVAWQYQSRDGSWNSFLNDKHYDDTKADGSWPIRALYTAPQSAAEPHVPEVGFGNIEPLTDEQIEAIVKKEMAPSWATMQTFARAIEAAHGIGGTST